MELSDARLFIYYFDKYGPVKYKLSKKSRLFTIYQKNDKNKWYKWESYIIAHSFEDKAQSDLRLDLLIKDGSSVIIIPKSETGSLVILDLAGEELIDYVYE